jgi:hypothetical protein
VESQMQVQQSRGRTAWCSFSRRPAGSESRGAPF